jgi:hypothetical protein
MVTSVGRSLSLGVVAFAAGCSDDGGSTLADAPPPAPAAYLGIWHATGGDLLGANAGQVEYLELADDGTGALRTNFQPYNILGCGLDVLHVDLGDGLISVDLGSGGSHLFRYATPDADHLVLSDQLERTLSFERVGEVPADAKCRELAPSDTTTDIRPTLGYWSGLAYQSSTSLWYADEANNVYAVNPSSGAVTPAPANLATQFVQVQTFEGANYWAHCACGNNDSMELWSPNGGTTAVDTLNTTTLGAQVSIDGAASDGTTLWVHGYSYDSASYRFLKVTGGIGARTLADSFEFAPVDSLATLDGKLWGLLATPLGIVLIDIDVTTKKATATYALPAGVQWAALSAGSGSLWVFGTEPDGDGQLLRITP